LSYTILSVEFILRNQRIHFIISKSVIFWMMNIWFELEILKRFIWHTLSSILPIWRLLGALIFIRILEICRFRFIMSFIWFIILWINFLLLLLHIIFTFFNFFSIWHWSILFRIIHMLSSTTTLFVSHFIIYYLIKNIIIYWKVNWYIEIL
jgi:hypothetical protein